MNGALPQNEFRNLGWQPAGNWVVSAGEFSSIPVTHRRHPDNEQKNRDAQFAPKNGQKPKPSRWPAYTSSAHRKGQKPSPAAGYFFSISRPGAPLRGGRHVVNRAHRRTISAAPQEVSLSRRNSNIGCCSGVVRREPCQIHFRPHTASMSPIIAAFASGLEERR